MEGAPCNMTLQRLDLVDCHIRASGMDELARAVSQGVALPNVEGLQLGGNHLKDQGVVKEGGLSNLK